MNIIDQWARRTLESRLSGLQGGTLSIVDGEGVTSHGASTGSPAGAASLDAALCVHVDRFYRRVLTRSDVGLGEAYVDGDWSSPDLVTFVRLMLRNVDLVERRSVARALVRALGRWRRRRRDNSIEGSRRHIHEHYDLGNDFFRLFLDDHLMYSCAVYDACDATLEQAQRAKLDRICRRLSLGPGDHLLEIGGGWGGLAVWAATRYGCRVTTTTISEEQYRHAVAWASRLGEAGARIDVRKVDYRELSGRFDKIVSIEMFEAVGLRHYDDYFGSVERLLAPDGVMLLQTITVDEQRFPDYQGSPDWIEQYIFPGGELASVGEILRSLTRVTSLSLYHAENIGRHYARTLHQWRARFRERLDDVRALGFDERFLRTWDLYLAFCEAAFLERHIGLFQFLLSRNYSRATLFNEPWRTASAESALA